ncbi:MAG: ABC transporter transmembrane domain-containing protein [Paraglaciecola sp.]|nr:ABC transporter transmembrane domain-containing protein [Paraglaciecola sp.]MDP5029707.1 ABC transporter transmembrane domain-containing protein [Paraglaciecola sp.]MDP5131675.1 ABC transporter transmembrane domain-containing protein [Paraglaciecola sp.]
MKKHTTKTLMAWLFGQLKPYKLQVAWAMLALIVGAMSWLVLGQGVKYVVDQGFVANNAQRLNELVLLVLGIGLIGSVATYFRFYYMIWLGERVSADIRQNVYSHLLTLSPAFFAETRTGEVISRFTSDTTVLQSVVGMGLSMALRATVTFIGSLILMMLTSPMLTLYVLIAVPIVLLPIRIFGAKVRIYARNSQDRVADVGAYIDESLHEIQTVQAYTHESIDKQRFFSRIDGVMDAARKRIQFRALMIATIMGISLFAITLVAWLGAQLVLNSELTAGELTAFMFYAVMAGGSVATISEVIGEIQKAAGASERLMELLHTKSTVQTQDKPVLLPQKVKGELSLNHISFYYPVADHVPVLKDITLHIKSGERIALVGPSGAGKSTLFQLLLRFYDVQEGDIILDGQPIAQLNIQQLRQQFALVSQESVIFACSVFDNIAYGRPSASYEAVIAAAKAARADEFVCEFSEAYDTQLGERGVRLSGGQKQRIAIARAILADRPVLLLDEATSALDAGNEVKVKQALDELMKDKTTIIIAHRLSTVINADRIIVMEKGRIIASGTHQELMVANPLYRELAELQLIS